MTQSVSGTPVAFVNVAERDRALGFYCGVIGLQLHSSDPFGDFVQMDGALLRTPARSGRGCTLAPVCEVRWRPMAAYELIARYYGPEPALFDGSWRLLDVEAV